jgi:hypothetical protein
VNNTFVRTQPAKLGMLSEFLADIPKIGHEFFDLTDDDFRAELLDASTDNLIAQAEGQDEPRTKGVPASAKQGCGECVFRA